MLLELESLNKFVVVVELFIDVVVVLVNFWCSCDVNEGVISVDEPDWDVDVA